MQSAGALERENTFLNGQLERHLVSNKQLEADNIELQRQVQFYANSATNGQLATLPKTEIAELRHKEAALQEAQLRATKAEKSEKNLRDTVARLREGKVLSLSEDMNDYLSWETTRPHF